jgi:hypothetical protein
VTHRTKARLADGREIIFYDRAPIDRWVKPEEFVELQQEADDIGFAGFTVDGGLAELMVTPERCARPLDALRDRFHKQELFEIGALCEPDSGTRAGHFRESTIRCQACSSCSNASAAGLSSKIAWMRSSRRVPLQPTVQPVLQGRATTGGPNASDPWS